MKVILLQDVAKLGRRFDVVEAPTGYAMNKLIPQRLAEAATPENLKRVQARQGKREAEREQVDATFATAKETLTEQTLTVTAPANEQGHLFKAVNEADVVAAATAIGVTLTPEQVHIKTPIKDVGEHTVELHSGTDTATITISVVASS